MNQLFPWQVNLKAIETTMPGLRYDENTDFKAWQKAARKKLSELLGMDRIQKPQEPVFIIEYTKECEDYTEYRLRIQSEENYNFPCVMLVPKKAKHPIPTMLCLQGHSTGMHISLGRPIHAEDEGDIRDGDRDFAIRAVKEGCIGVAIEQRNFGECGARKNGSPDCHVSTMSALLLGRTTIGERDSRAVSRSLAVSTWFSRSFNSWVI